MDFVFAPAFGKARKWICPTSRQARTGAYDFVIYYLAGCMGSGCRLDYWIFRYDRTFDSRGNRNSKRNAGKVLGHAGVRKVRETNKVVVN